MALVKTQYKYEVVYSCHQAHATRYLWIRGVKKSKSRYLCVAYAYVSFGVEFGNYTSMSTPKEHIRRLFFHGENIYRLLSDVLGNIIASLVVVVVSISQRAMLWRGVRVRKYSAPEVGRSRPQHI